MNRPELFRCLAYAIYCDRGGVETWPFWVCSMDPVHEAVKRRWLDNSGRLPLVPRLGMSRIVYSITEDGKIEFARLAIEAKDGFVLQAGAEVGRRVVCAALRNDVGEIICSPRHWDALTRAQAIGRDGNGYRTWLSAEQGFVDQRGVFMTRIEALFVARAAGQIIRRCGGDEGELFSENLY